MSSQYGDFVRFKVEAERQSSSQELRKFQFCVIILGNPSKPQKHTVINSTLRSVVSGDKDVYIMGDFNIDLLKCESSQISQDFLLSLRSCYLIPTVDKATSVHRTSATLIDDTFVNNPDPLFASGNIISDISDHFSQFCITTSAKDKLQQVKNIKIRDYSRFSADRFNDELSEAAGLESNNWKWKKVCEQIVFIVLQQV